ncbi:hypothetical protein BST96_14220 [Oceanicoccus sagamiensis]|uniref:Heme-binding protein n=2 Tax=Oceanicoccus sagamiensis TaxID=716816 RepID=A0A1X9NI31_9GAMM|nr:hypothetical protein BST96_14220 [Oceanicoccus sagamiensis]
MALSLEQPDYTVIYEQGDIEYRYYDAYLVVETVIENDQKYKSAANEGFRRLFRYISGNNKKGDEIAMTKPVQQVKTSETIALDDISIESTVRAGNYAVSFVLPKKYNAVTAPQPLDPRVSVVMLPAKTVAVYRYSGRWTESNFKRSSAKLNQSLQQQAVNAIGEVRSAFYNAPFMLPFLRRNEVLVEVSNLPESYTQQGGDLAATLY